MAIYPIIYKLPSKSNYEIVIYNACITKIWGKKRNTNCQINI